jgi:hypothetical protein
MAPAFAYVRFTHFCCLSRKNERAGREGISRCFGKIKQKRMPNASMALARVYWVKSFPVPFTSIRIILANRLSRCHFERVKERKKVKEIIIEAREAKFRARAMGTSFCPCQIHPFLLFIKKKMRERAEKAFIATSAKQQTRTPNALHWPVHSK